MKSIAVTLTDRGGRTNRAMSSSQDSPMMVRDFELSDLDMNPEIARNYDYNDDYADDVEDVHCL
jgi:hypothetical protein